MTTALIAREGDWSGLGIHFGWVYDGPVLSHGSGSFEPDYLGAWLVRKGTARVAHGKQNLEAGPGQWLVPWPGFRRQSFSADAQILSVRFRAHWPDGRPLFEHGLSLRFAARKHPELEKAAVQLLGKIRPFHDPARPHLLSTVMVPFDDFVAMQGRLLEFVLVFTRTLVAEGLLPSRLGIRDERVLNALRWLDNRSLASRFVEKELAKEVGLGASQFVRLFCNEIGVTPKRYFEHRRRDASLRLLAGSSIPIKQIAVDLGFFHLSDFSTWFKSFHGCSPRSFRQGVTEGGRIDVSPSLRASSS